MGRLRATGVGRVNEAAIQSRGTTCAVQPKRRGHDRDDRGHAQGEEVEGYVHVDIYRERGRCAQEVEQEALVKSGNEKEKQNVYHSFTTH